MSKKPRTEQQKLRRKYLDECKKKSMTPDAIQVWRLKLAKKANKTAKPAKKIDKPAARKPHKVFVEKGDIVIFRGYAPNQLMRLAMLMLVDVLKDISECKH